MDKQCKCGELLFDGQDECYECARDIDDNPDNEWNKRWVSN